MSGLFIIPSVVCSSVLVSEAAGRGEVYGFLAFPFLSNLLLLTASHLVLGPRVVGRRVGRTPEVAT